MKPLVIFLVLLTACTSQPNEIIRQKAIDNEQYSFLNKIVEYYSRAYYALPPSKKDLYSFVIEWRSIGSSSAIFERYHGDVFDALLFDRIEFAYFIDSVFIYAPTLALGCRVIGSPFYWLENPDKYDPYKPDFNEWFQPAAYDKEGNYLFEEEFDYRQITSAIDSIASQYACRITHEGYYYDGLSDKPQRKQVPYMSIVAFTPDNDTIETLSMTKTFDSLFVFDKESLTYQSVNNSLPTLCKDYSDNVVAAIKKIFKKNPILNRIIMGLHWYCNNDSTLFYDVSDDLNQ